MPDRPAMPPSNRPVVIVKRRRKAAAAPHHGGAWKVAYADFVTAMMAFFLLLWLLNVTTDEQKRGIADYFDPSNVARGASGAGGVLGGRTVMSPGQMVSPSSPFALQVAMPGRPDFQQEADLPDLGNAEEATEAETEGAATAGADGSARGGGGDRLSPGLSAAAAEDLSDSDLAAALAEREARQFAQAEQALRQAMQSVPELQALAQNLIVDQTPEGLRIQIIDQDGRSMFPTGGAEMFGYTRQLMGLVAQVVAQLPNRISIRGHTDSTPFAVSGRYGNWELSADRANASRRALIEAGLPAGRIAFVVGKADTEPLMPDTPADPRNRRISIILLRDAPPGAGTG